jgi:hypothetical protein
MPISINVEEFCVFKAQQEKLANGHNPKRCPQCNALRRVVILTNNETLDMIANVFKATAPSVKLDPQEVYKQIEGLKTVH